MKKFLFLIVLFCALISMPAYFASDKSTVAIVEKDGQTLYRFDLATITTTTYYTVEDEGGSNVICVSPEGIGITKADCPDQTCVKMGMRSHGPQPIVCLPHKLTIRFTAQEGDADFVTGN